MQRVFKVDMRFSLVVSVNESVLKTGRLSFERGYELTEHAVEMIAREYVGELPLLRGCDVEEFEEESGVVVKEIKPVRVPL